MIISLFALLRYAIIFCVNCSHSKCQVALKWPSSLTYYFHWEGKTKTKYISTTFLLLLSLLRLHSHYLITSLCQKNVIKNREKKDNKSLKTMVKQLEVFVRFIGTLEIQPLVHILITCLLKVFIKYLENQTRVWWISKKVNRRQLLILNYHWTLNLDFLKQSSYKKSWNSYRCKL